MSKESFNNFFPEIAKKAAVRSAFPLVVSIFPSPTGQDFDQKLVSQRRTVLERLWFVFSSVFSRRFFRSQFCPARTPGFFK